MSTTDDTDINAEAASSIDENRGVDRRGFVRGALTTAAHHGPAIEPDRRRAAVARAGTRRRRHRVRSARAIRRRWSSSRTPVGPARTWRRSRVSAGARRSSARDSRSKAGGPGPDVGGGDRVPARAPAGGAAAVAEDLRRSSSPTSTSIASSVSIPRCCARSRFSKDRLAKRRSRQTPRSAPVGIAGPLHGIPYGIKDLFAVRGTKDHVGIQGAPGPGHRRRFRGLRQAARRGRRPHREACDRLVRAGRPLVSRPDEESVEPHAGIERFVRGSRLGDRRGLRCVRHRHGDAGLDRFADDSQRPQRAASHVRPRESLWRNGALVEHGQGRPDVPDGRRLRAGLQHDSRRRREGPCHGHRAVPLRSQGRLVEAPHRLRRTVAHQPGLASGSRRRSSANLARN